MMIHSHNHSDYSDKMQKSQDYIHALQEEHKKIQVFQRELPLCLELVTQAIEACKQQLSGTNLHGESECSEQISSEGPIFEEFIPINRALSNSGEDEEHFQKPNNINSKNINEKSFKKSDWLRSVGLWNQTPDPTPEEDLPKKASFGAFRQFKKKKSVGTKTTTARGGMNRAVPPPMTAATIAANSMAEKGSGSKKEGQSERKARRTWSPELHKRFLQALEQLGASHVATPKQIKEFMKVDGLTNDEVKSHLQKYRLHSRSSPNHSIHNNNNPQPPQFVVVGGIWVPPQEYAAMAATTASEEASGVSASSNRIYAPIATLPPPFPGSSSSPKQRQQYKQAYSDDRHSHIEGRDHVHSTTPAGSSSYHTTNTSPTHRSCENM